MVALTEVQASNALIRPTYPSGLVVVFVGATAGIGELSLKEFARQAPSARIYFTGRSQQGGDRILSELKTVNPGGEYIFLQTDDASLLRNVDDLCRQIKAKEKYVNVLCLSQGSLKLGTSYYARMRFIANLLPLLRAAPGLRRVVNVAAGTKEGKVFPDDWQALKIPFASARGHVSSIITLAHVALAREAPDVSFIHDYPGYVKTGLIRGDEPLLLRVVLGTLLPLLGTIGIMPVVSHEECGQRHAYYCTTGRYPSRDGGKDRVPLQGGEVAAVGVDGKRGSGVYAVDEHGESAGQKVVHLLNEMVEDGVVDSLWKHTVGKFERITGNSAI